MVNYRLMISGEVENVSSIEPMGGCNDPNFTYYFKLKCEQCGEVTPKEISIILEEVVAIPKSRGHANLIHKCKFCGRDANVTMVPGFGRPLTAHDCETGNYAPLMTFDCRGLEPVHYYFGGDQWKVVTTAGTVFESVDLSVEDWAEYDEKGSMPVSITNLKSRFDVVKA